MAIPSLQVLDPSIPYFVARVFMDDGGQIEYMWIAKRGNEDKIP